MEGKNVAGRSYTTQLEKVLKDYALILNKTQLETCDDNVIENWFLREIKKHSTFSVRLLSGDYFQFRLGLNRKEKLGKYDSLKKAIQYRFITLCKKYVRRGLIEKFNNYQYKMSD